METNLSNVGDNISANIGNWSFGGEVAKTFDDHITKSVPGYLEGHDLISKIAPFFLAEKGVKCFEIGCSTGKLTNTIRSYTKRDDIEFIGIDLEESMINFANKNNKYENSRFETADVLDYDLSGSSMITSYFTIQFINPSVRQLVIDKVYNSLNWGGAFLFFEKVRGPDARFHDIMQTLYTEYKLDQGFNEKEIISKSLSLKGVLEPFSTDANVKMLQRAGFEDINTIHKKLSFEGYLAIK